MFLGEFEHTVDKKGRVTIPARFRDRLAVGLVVTKGIDLCLWLYPMDIWATLAEKIDKLPLTNPRARGFRRQVFGGAFDVTPDRQGRITLPSCLREYANIDNSATIIGLHDHCEIWNPEQWKELQVQSYNDPEGRAAQYESLGI
ncbi:MAG: division/cell wall cluster transcriptional repressor MraZ [Anaerolineae bacterium]|jgi:MraZ protein